MLFSAVISEHFSKNSMIIWLQKYCIKNVLFLLGHPVYGGKTTEENSNLDVLVVVSKGTQEVKLCSNKILQCMLVITGVPCDGCKIVEFVL